MLRRISRLALVTAILMGMARFGMTQVTPQADVPGDAQPDQSRWPLVLQNGDSEVMIFQPQLEDFQGNTIKGRAAVSVTKANQDPIYGAVWLESQVDTDRVARTVHILDVKVTQTRFPGMEDQASNSLGDTIAKAMTDQQAVLSLDQLLSMLETVQKENDDSADLQNNPPKIIFRDHPAIKVQYDGPPRLTNIDNSQLMRIANTPFFVVLDPRTKNYYLKGAGMWFVAPDPLGPFRTAQGVPQDVSALADSSDYKDPEQPVDAAKAAALEIVTATEPTELIWTDGPVQMATIPNVGLLYVANTDSDVFVQIDNQQQFVLLSGRWYTAPNRNGPWTYVAPDQLPEDFKHIPPNSEQGDVLAHVAGTQAASDALADAEIPQTAAVDRKQFDQPTVQYDGAPQFQAVEDLPITYAVNTDTPVVFAENRYYACNDAVWYSSISAVGPWDICTTVPQVIYRLPPSCPIYSVRFCHVYGYTPDFVYVGYTPGYVGCYTYRGVVVYGTGYHYNPWWGRRYYARPLTFGFAAHYNSYVGHWGFSFGLAAGSGGGIWIGQGSRSWGRRDPWFGYGGYRPVIVHHDVHEDMFRRSYIARVRNEPNVRNDRNNNRIVVPNARVNTEDRFSRNVYERRNDVRPVAHVTPRTPPAMGRPQPTVRRDDQRSNDVFADHEGNVYRRTNNGWEVRDRQQWRPGNVDTPRTPPAPNRDNQADRGNRGNDNGNRGAVDSSPRQIVVPNARPAQPDVRPANPQPRQVAPPTQRPEPQPTPTPRTPPAPSRGDGGLNRDAQARDAGESRLRNYERPAAQAPSRAPAAQPRTPPAPSQNQGPQRGR
ncbi:MAG TPA: hypothetical protein VHD56_13670 [Tepidisphaeraceae bacterium]|nr:hypothetical protein [Tepidisphaeraceae bacterium]